MPIVGGAEASRRMRAALRPGNAATAQIISNDSRIVDDNGRKRSSPRRSMIAAIFTQEFP